MPPVSVEEADQLLDSLNADQRAFVDRVLEAVDNEDAPRLLCLLGPGGTGKTHTYNVLVKYLASRKKSSVAAAYTGVAANLLLRGWTSHKAFGLPLEDKGLGMSTSTLNLGSKAAKALEKAAAIIWDEVSMAHAFQLHVLDKFLRILMRKQNVPFSEKCIILGGDFRHVLPTVRKGSRADIIDASITSSTL